MLNNFQSKFVTEDDVISFCEDNHDTLAPFYERVAELVRQDKDFNGEDDTFISLVAFFCTILLVNQVDYTVAENIKFPVDINQEFDNQYETVFNIILLDYVLVRLEKANLVKRSPDSAVSLTKRGLRLKEMIKNEERS